LIIISILVSGVSLAYVMGLRGSMKEVTDLTRDLSDSVTETEKAIETLTLTENELVSAVGEVGKALGEYGENIASIEERIASIEEATSEEPVPEEPTPEMEGI
jgi:chromosome segregation ATPase